MQPIIETMKFLYHRFLDFFNSIKSKIAFYPTLFAIAGFGFAMLMLYLENRGISAWVIDKAPTLVINNADTAKTLLSFLTGGIISIMVFSFSMVMVLLSQASSNYSPRVLPGLISKRNHQIVLGFYLATIIYNTFTTVGIDPKDNDTYQLPGFSVLLGIVFTVMCFGAFLYFIHSISTSIQVNNILEGIYEKTKTGLEKMSDSDDSAVQDFRDTSHWYKFESKRTGCFQKIDVESLTDLCKKHEIKIDVRPLPGTFILKGIPVVRVNRMIDNDLRDKILANFNFSQREYVENNYALGFKQITEIGIKAMSPGINDPGTAISTIDYLTELFALRMQKVNNLKKINKDDEQLVSVQDIPFDALLYQIMVTFRTYCKADMTCLQKLMIMLHYLDYIQTNEIYRRTLKREAKLLFNDAKKNLDNRADVKVLERSYRKIVG